MISFINCKNCGAPYNPCYSTCQYCSTLYIGNVSINIKKSIVISNNRKAIGIAPEAVIQLINCTHVTLEEKLKITRTMKTLCQI